MNKVTIYNATVEGLNKRLESILASIQSVQESMVGEEKSTAGDKYETARAMAQNELIRLSDQQKLVIHDLTIMDRIKPGNHPVSAQLGSLIKTDKRLIYISVAMGKLEVDGQEVIVVSPTAPLAQAVLNAAVGDKFSFNGKAEAVINLT